MVLMVYKMFVDPSVSSERTLFALRCLNLIANFKKNWPEISIYNIEESVRNYITKAEGNSNEITTKYLLFVYVLNI